MDLLDIGLYGAYVLVAVAILGGLGFSLVNIVTKRGGLLKTGIAIGAILVLFFVSYSLASDEVSLTQRAMGLSETTGKLVSAGLIMTYVAGILAVVALIFSEVIKVFR